MRADAPERSSSSMIESEQDQALTLDETVPLETIADNRAAAIALAEQARQSLAIYTRDLDKRVLDHIEFVTAVKRLAIRSRYTSVRILVEDPVRAVKRGHRLIHLGHRVPSLVQFRRPAEEYLVNQAVFMVADEIGVLYRSIADRYTGRASFNDPKAARQLLSHFNQVWENSDRHPYLRRLDL